MASRDLAEDASAAPLPSRLSDRGREAVDRFLGSDPGLTRLRTALMAVLGIGAALLAEDVFVRTTHALQIDTHGAALPSADAALVAAQHHGVLVLAMLFGAIMALLFSFAGDARARGLVTTGLLMPLPIVATFTAALALDHHRVAGLALLPVALAAGTYARRWGPRGFLGGQLLFMGAFMGFLIGPEVRLGQLGWVAGEMAIGVAVGLAVRLVLFFPKPTRDLQRSQRSWVARARRALDLALRVVDAPRDERLVRRLHRQLVRLNESSLIIDALLAAPDAVRAGPSASLLHQRTFDLELALSNVARFTVALAGLDLEPSRRRSVRQTLSALRAGDQEAAEVSAYAVLHDLRAHPDDPAAVLPHRFARSALDLIEAQRDWLSLGQQVTGDDEVAFQPAAALFNGWLPGSAMVAAKASMTRGTSSFQDRLTMPPYVRTAVQIGVAVTGAIAAGDALNGRRFYWAVLAAFVTFMATSNTGEQVRKAFTRLAGTAVGIVLGIGIVHVTRGHDAASLAVIMVALFLALYLIRISYVFMVLGITIVVSQLYVQLDEFSDHLLLLRLEETAIGFGVVVLTVLVVLPLHPMRVLRAAAGNSAGALVETLVAAGDVLVEGESAERKGRLMAAIRGLDATYQDMLAVTRPMRGLSYGDSSDRLATALGASAATRHYARNLPSDLDGWTGVPERERASARAAVDELVRSVRRVATRIDDGSAEPYVRSAGRFDGVQRALDADDTPARLVFRDLALLDGAMARVADDLGMTVLDHDTSSARGAAAR